MSDALHKQMYEEGRQVALELQADAELPSWDDLTEEQKETMRKVNYAYMDNLDEIAGSFIGGIQT